MKKIVAVIFCVLFLSAFHASAQEESKATGSVTANTPGDETNIQAEDANMVPAENMENEENMQEDALNDEGYGNDEEYYGSENDMIDEEANAEEPVSDNVDSENNVEESASDNAVDENVAEPATNAAGY